MTGLEIFMTFVFPIIWIAYVAVLIKKYGLKNLIVNSIVLIITFIIIVLLIAIGMS